MSHLIIFMLVLNLIVGTAGFLYILRKYRLYRREYLKTLLAYVTSFNGLVIVYLLYQYALTNVYGRYPERVFEVPFVFLLLLFLVYCAEIGITVNLFRFVRHLKGREMTGTAKWLFFIWVVLFGGASVWGMIHLFRKSQMQVFYWIHAGWMFSISLIILTLLVLTLLKGVKGGEDRNSLRSFSWIFLACYAAFAFSSLDFYFFHTGVQGFYDPVVLLLINLCPLLWMRLYFEKENPVMAVSENIEERLTQFCDKYAVSNREREIIQQVMMGKSNKEIERILFISFNTVKNHLYNVFQKTGVGSRSELIHRINRFGE